jgi:hypothetical protein
MTAPDARLFQDLAACDPIEVCKRANCEYDGEQYDITIWDERYLINPRSEKIEYLGENRPPHPYFNIFIINYLLHSQKIDSSGEWVSEKDFPGGATFFRGPHQLPTALVTQSVGNDLNVFAKICKTHGGKKLDLADVSYEFHLLPNISIAALFWSGDEDFPAEVTLLFERNLGSFLALDTIYALAVETCHRLSL